MTVLVLSALILVGGLCAGLIGSLSGLGGGVVIVPLLTLVSVWTSATRSARRSSR